MTVFALPTSLPSSRLGVAATRRIGGAVRRNRAKRLAREVFRRHRPERVNDVVIVPRREMLDAPFLLLEADFLEILRRSTPRQSDGSPRRVQDRTGRAQGV
jgi:ribonuclease P protein component